jgi:hypothetical protein
MNLDFKELSLTDQVKAIKNVISEDESLTYLAYLIGNGEASHDVYGWFTLGESDEGDAYWYDVKKEIDEKV